MGGDGYRKSAKHTMLTGCAATIASMQYVAIRHVSNQHVSNQGVATLYVSMNTCEQALVSAPTLVVIRLRHFFSSNHF